MNLPTKEQLKKLLFTKSGKPKCLKCDKVMKMATDTITKKKSRYEKNRLDKDKYLLR